MIGPCPSRQGGGKDTSTHCTVHRPLGVRTFPMQDSTLSTLGGGFLTLRPSLARAQAEPVYRTIEAADAGSKSNPTPKGAESTDRALIRPSEILKVGQPDGLSS
jgi:hypothetical protein